jgi:trigger factor
MDIQITKLPQSQIEMIITVSVVEMDKYMDKTAQKLSKQISIQGFRKGGAPRQVVAKYVGEKVFFAETIETAVNQSYIQAVQKEGIHVIEHPQIELPENPNPTEPLTYTAKVSVLPEITLPDYIKIASSIAKEEVNVDETDLVETKDYLLKSRAKYTEVSRVSKTGDQVTIDYTVKVKDEEVDNAQNHSVTLGENKFIPGFEENLTGLKVGEEKSFTLKFPKEYGNKKIAGKKAMFSIKVHKVSKIELPKWGDDFAKDLTNGKFETITSLEENIKEGITEEKRVENENVRREKIMNAIIAEIKEELPTVLIDSELNNIIQDMTQEAMRHGDTLEAYLERTDKSMEQLRKELLPQAETRAKVLLTLRKIAETENIQIDQNELTEKMAAFLSRYSEKDAKEIDQERLRLIIEGDLLDKRVLEYLMDIKPKKKV